MVVKNTKDLFKKMNISRNALQKNKREMLNEKGFTIMPPTKFVLKNIQLLNKVTNNLLKKEGILYR